MAICTRVFFCSLYVLYACVYSVLRNKYAETQLQAGVTLFVIDHECVFLTNSLVECKENGANAKTITTDCKLVMELHARVQYTLPEQPNW